jgi:RNA polymerase-associated protein
MSSFSNKRSVMTLYSSATDPYSHRVRIVLAEKGVTCEIVDVDLSPKALEELASYNPYGSIPTLVDRDLVLYKSEIIMEYLDERFPHPPLMPVFPVTKARSRVAIHRINNDWYSLMDKILNPNTPPHEVQTARKELTDSITSIIPIFVDMPYFLSEEMTLVDCCIAPMLWRLPVLGIQLPPQAKPVLDYANRLFKLNCFTASLSDKERAMRI